MAKFRQIWSRWSIRGNHVLLLVAKALPPSSVCRGSTAGSRESKFWVKICLHVSFFRFKTPLPSVWSYHDGHLSSNKRSSIDQINRMEVAWTVWPDWASFQSFLVTKLRTKAVQIFSFFWGLFWKTSVLSKRIVATFGIFETVLATFYSNIWSHFSRRRWANTGLPIKKSHEALWQNCLRIHIR